jgi:hypothetical protein
MEQKCHIISLFWLQMTISYTDEGRSWPKNDYFGMKCAFLVKKDLFEVKSLRAVFVGALGCILVGAPR